MANMYNSKNVQSSSNSTNTGTTSGTSGGTDGVTSSTNDNNNLDDYTSSLADQQASNESETFSFDPLGENQSSDGTGVYLTDDQIKSGNETADNYDKFGNLIRSDQVETQPYSFEDKGIKILGLPLYFNPIADPFNRVFEKTFESDLPLVYITPGVPKINKRIISMGKDSSMDVTSTMSGLVNAESFGIKRVSNYQDTRFINFKQDYTSYYKYVQTMLTYLYTMLGINNDFLNIFKFEDYFKLDENKQGLCYFADKSTSISESANNSYGETSIAQNANQLASSNREYRQYLGMQEGGLVSNILSGITDLISNATANIPIVGKILGAFSTSLNGSQLFYPQIWQDSQYSRNFSISFKFYSPYGDIKSIFRYVYLPFISLLALALPLQDGVYGYKQPFLVRLSSPGWFQCECGAITSIDFKMGGDESLWTSGNLPNEIEVTLSIQDLYPVMMDTERIDYMKYNIGLSSFLECMSGISFNQLSYLDRYGLEMKAQGNMNLSNLSIPGLRHKYSDFWTNFNNSTGVI